MGKRTAGTCYIKLDGTQLDIKGGLECPISDVQREAVKSSTRVVGFKEMPTTPYVKLTAIFTPDFPRAQIAESTDMTVTAEFANGEVYTLSGAWLANEAAAKGEEGEVELEFNGERGIWQ